MTMAIKVIHGNSRASNSFAREQILDAALRCYQKPLFERPSMERIAQEANISRTTIYRHFKNRNEILVSLALILIQNLIIIMNERISHTESFAEFVVESIVVAFDQIPRFPFFSAMQKESSLIIGFQNEYNKKIFELVSEHFRSRFDEASAAGLLRNDMDFNRFIDWIIYISSTTLTARSARSTPHQLREMLSYFLVPAVVR